MSHGIFSRHEMLVIAPWQPLPLVCVQWPGGRPLVALKSQAAPRRQSHLVDETEMVSKRRAFIKNLVQVVHLSLKLNSQPGRFRSNVFFYFARLHIFCLSTYSRIIIVFRGVLQFRNTPNDKGEKLGGLGHDLPARNSTYASWLHYRLHRAGGVLRHFLMTLRMTMLYLKRLQMSHLRSLHVLGQSNNL